ncbi:MAG TPA: S8/S53 family peptidase, partial [Anaerolineales bacterium]|nr:S8/S53 family peptidase [Anaerolineales bacterium]
VINCSFMLNLPDHSALDENLERMTVSIREIFERLGTQQKLVMVAAAGNEGHILRPRPPTLYPAAFRNVFGVGALKNARPGFNGIYQAAAYSNWADDQNSDEGYMTLGGEGGAEQGILGLYIGEFPTLSFFWRIWDDFFGWLFGPSSHAHVKYRRNTTAWAWWTGTSFSAAILSGILAALPSQPGNRRSLDSFRNAQIALDRITQPSSSGQVEKVISAEQLPP